MLVLPQSWFGHGCPAPTKPNTFAGQYALEEFRYTWQTRKLGVLRNAELMLGAFGAADENLHLSPEEIDLSTLESFSVS